MRPINLNSLIQANSKLEETLFIQYCRYFGFAIKNRELDDLNMFVKNLVKVNNNIEVYNTYYVGYKIPQIGKEFDLLRFGKNFVLNVELKSESTEDKIKKQLSRNKYYLSFLDLRIFNYTYVSSTNKLFFLNEDNELEEEKYEDLINLIESQKVKEISNVDTLFDPTNYLVSPFNSTHQFIKNQYFLTHQQEEIKTRVLRKFSNVKYSFVSICGKAGTGKTLLTYDIAKELMDNSNVLLIHCGNLNGGHQELIGSYNWSVIRAKDIKSINYSKYKFVIVDETQRIYPSQLEHIINSIKENNGNCIFSYDISQCLKSNEIRNNIEKQIITKANPEIFQLTEKIRTNVDIAWFITALFNKSKQILKFNTSKIELNYFDNYKDAREFLEILNQENWKIINYTPTYDKVPYHNYNISGEDTAHTVIGQEFDNVVVVIDSHFYYKNDELSTKNYQKSPYYHPTKMLYQIITRTRKRLNVIIINNSEIMERCLSVLNI